MGNAGYNPVNKPETIPDLVRSRNDAPHRANGPETAVDARCLKGLIVSEPSSPRQIKSWRRQFGPFVAQETGAKYQPACSDYEPKSREKAPRRVDPLTEADVTRERANLREDLGKPTSPERSATLEGIYRWLESCKSLTPEERAELEKKAALMRPRVAPGKGES